MKLHLPVRLFRAIIALMVAVPAFTQAVEIPSTYTTIFVTTTGEVTSTTYTSTDIAFLLQNDLTFSGATAMSTSSGERIFTSADPSERSSLFFTSDTDLYVNTGEKLTIAGLNTVTFQKGGAEYSKYDNTEYTGGAIYAKGTGAITLQDNVSIYFLSNYAKSSSSPSYSYGGAIYSYRGAITLSGNDSVTFSGNYSSNYYSYGGAIYSYSGAITLSGNDSVTFSGNYSSSNYYSYGGAIYSGTGDISLSENGSIEIINNSARSKESTNCAYAGAIYSEGKVLIRDNESVLFAQNYEQHGEGTTSSPYTYRLRGLYTTSDAILSAASGDYIEFQDSMHVGGQLELNSQYTNNAGDTVAQTGDIIFTGAYTAAHLGVLKEAYTDAEYKNSQTSDVAGLTTLYDGRLIIRDGAISGGAGLTVASSASGLSTPTVLLQNAKLNHVGADISFAEGTRLEVSGQSVISAANMTMSSGSQLTLHVMGENMSSPVLNYYGTFTMGESLTLNISFNDETAEAGTYKLMSVTSFSDAANWTADKVTVNGLDGFEVSFDAVYWEDNVLWLNFDGEAGVGKAPALTEATWSNLSGTHEWDLSDKNWKQDKYQYAYEDGVAVVFGDTAAGGVTLVGDLTPGSVLVNNSLGNATLGRQTPP